MNELRDTFLMYVAPTLLSLLGAASAWALTKLAGYIQAKTKNEWLKGALVRLDDAVIATVRELQQVVVSGLKEASADGVLTDEEKDRVKAQAVAAVKALLGKKGLLELAKILGLNDGTIEKLIGSKIEAAVYDLKANPTLPKP